MTQMTPYRTDGPVQHMLAVVPEHEHGIRASDADREQVARILRAAAGEGMLSLGEADERLAALYAARFRSELAPLTADLPDGGRSLLENTAEARAAARAGLFRHFLTVSVVAGLLVTLWALSDAPFFWPVWPLAFMAFSVLRHARRIGYDGPARWRRRRSVDRAS
ncbi:MAG: DUF1707 domain-containing protein [Geodermatophilaceae bacterium]